MGPYTAERKKKRPKFRYKKNPHSNKVSRNEKLEVKNANRSLKKAARQEAKKELRDIMSEKDLKVFLKSFKEDD